MAWTLVTGGAKRLGAAICYALAKEGCSLVIHYRHSKEEALQTAMHCRQHGVNAAICQGDFSTTESTQDFIERYLTQFKDTCHIVHNVGNYHIARTLETEIEVYNQLFQTNFYAPMAITKGLVESIKKNQGSIIHLGTAGIEHLRADVYCPIYSATKTCLLLATRSLAKELGPYQVRINMVSPGILNNSVDVPANLQTFVPMQRLGHPDEVARVITFLLKPENSYITGQNIEVAGGCRL